MSLFYGAAPWHYYLTQALPILTGTALPFVLHGCWQISNASGTSASRAVLGLIAWTICIYSFTGHKEWRFIHPILPLTHVIASKTLVDGCKSMMKHSKDRQISRNWQLPIRRRYIAFLSLALFAIVYVSGFHSRAQVEVIYYLRNLSPENIKSVGFLMPCHSTPWQAYLHKDLDPGHLWALGCEPPLTWVEFISKTNDHVF